MVRMWARATVLAVVAALTAGTGTTVVASAGAALPDGRGYELVSPPSKNGVEVIPKTDKTHVATDGNAVTFSALGGFGSVEGSSFDFEYLSRRTGVAGTSGWTAHGINPLERGATLASSINAATYVNGFAADLSAGVYKTWRPLVNAPNASDVSNLYRVGGLDRGPRTVQLMSDSVNPIPPSWYTEFNGAALNEIQPQLVGVSKDARHVTFESTLSLTSDAPAYSGLFCQLAGLGCPTLLYENTDGVLRLVGRIPQASDAMCDDVAGPPCVAAPDSHGGLSATVKHYSQRTVGVDGRRIIFDSSGGLYLREDGARTQRIAQSGQLWTASSDASRSVFITNDALLPDDADTNPDVYIYDSGASPAERLTLVSASEVAQGYAELVVDASADARTVYFVSDEQLIAGEPPAGIMGLYVWRGGQLRYVGQFQDFSEASFNSLRRDWSLVNSTSTERVTPDGRFLLFMTTSDAGWAGRGGFSGYDHAGHRELYLYDAEADSLSCVSCNPTGRAATADALIDVRDLAATSQPTSDSAQALTDDGKRVFFNTGEALVPEDVNGRPDAYEYDIATRTHHLLSTGRSTSPSYFIDATANGDDAFIVTRERLVGWDIDNDYDMYDVRVGGGLPEPVPPVPGCAADACLPSTSTPPATPAPNSTSYRGPGNVRASLRKHARTRCARKPAHKKAKKAARRCVKRKRSAHRRRR